VDHQPLDAERQCGVSRGRARTTGSDEHGVMQGHVWESTLEAALEQEQFQTRRARDREVSRDADQTRAEILEVGAHEFADAGYAGARVDQIAAHTRTTKRMIYYYFGGKEQLFMAVLDRAYAGIRRAEQSIDVEHLDPVSAIRRLAELTFDHHHAHRRRRAKRLTRYEAFPASCLA